MKINEGTLAALAVSKETPADKEGWLWKRGEVNKAFQKRYFVLRGNLLFYFEHRRLETAETSSCPSGVIVLEGCTVELAEEDLERFAFKIRFHCGSDLNCRDGNSSSSRRRVYHLGTDSQESLEEWMRLLACASHDYMKLMVYELQQKLTELDLAERSLGRCPAADAGGAPSRSKSAHEGLSSTSTGSSLALGAESNGIGPSSGHHPRLNPFSTVSTLEDLFLRTGTGQEFHDRPADATSAVGAQGGPQKSSWIRCHMKLGLKIAADRESWLAAKRADVR